MRDGLACRGSGARRMLRRRRARRRCRRRGPVVRQAAPHHDGRPRHPCQPHGGRARRRHGGGAGLRECRQFGRGLLLHRLARGQQPRCHAHTSRGALLFFPTVGPRCNAGQRRRPLIYVGPHAGKCGRWQLQRDCRGQPRLCAVVARRRQPHPRGRARPYLQGGVEGFGGHILRLRDDLGSRRLGQPGVGH